MKSELARALQLAPLVLLASLAVIAVSMRKKNPLIAAPQAASAMAANSATPASLAQAFVSGASGTTSASANAASAPIRMQHGDRRRAGREAVRGPSASNVKWKIDLADGPIEAQPIPSPDESVIYVATLGPGAAGVGGGHLIALARADGAVKFRFALGARSYATPCVDAKGNVYSASDAKKFFALHPDGTVAWTLDLDDEGDTACALADDGSVVFAAGRTLEAVRPNGDVAWRFAARGKFSPHPRSTIAVA